MIISASRRTDIPACYSDWFYNRIKDGFVYVRNPMNAHQISRIDLSPSVVDCIVFWTKNPKDMMPRLDELKDYKYYFQFTLTGYGHDVERGLPDKKEVLIPIFKELSKRIGRDKVIWRYDPILINDKYTMEYHIRAFKSIASELKGYTDKVIISFIDMYSKTKRNTEGLNIKDLTNDEMLYLTGKLSEIAHLNGIRIESCAEVINLSSVGIEHGCCIDKTLIEKIIGCEIKGNKDKNQRMECGCFESIDIGSYNTCRNGCRYCYANSSDSAVKTRSAAYDPASPMLCDAFDEASGDRLTNRKVCSLKEAQLSFI